MVTRDVWRGFLSLLNVTNFSYLGFFLQIPKIGHILYVPVSVIDWKENLYSRFRCRHVHFRGLKSHSDKSFIEAIAKEAEANCSSNLFSPSTMFCIKKAVSYITAAALYLLHSSVMGCSLLLKQASGINKLLVSPGTFLGYKIDKSECHPDETAESKGEGKVSISSISLCNKYLSKVNTK